MLYRQARAEPSEKELITQGDGFSGNSLEGIAQGCKARHGLRTRLRVLPDSCEKAFKSHFRIEILRKETVEWGGEVSVIPGKG